MAGSFPLHKAELREVLSDLAQIQQPWQWNPGCTRLGSEVKSPPRITARVLLIQLDFSEFPPAGSGEIVSQLMKINTPALCQSAVAPWEEHGISSRHLSREKQNRPWLKLQLDGDSPDVPLAATGDVEMRRVSPCMSRGRSDGNDRAWGPLERLWSHQGQPPVGYKPAEEA